VWIDRKRLSAETYYHVLFDEPLGQVETQVMDSVIRHITYDHPELEKSGITVNELVIKIEQILRFTSYDMAFGKFTKIEDYL
jgi:hypothetical protein